MTQTTKTAKAKEDHQFELVITSPWPSRDTEFDARVYSDTKDMRQVLVRMWRKGNLNEG